MQPKPTGWKRVQTPIWEQFATDQTDRWQVVLRQVSIPHDCLSISAAPAVPCRAGRLWATGVPIYTLRNIK